MRGWRPRYYILDADRNPVPTDMLTWGRWFARAENRIVRQEDVGPYSVSTVFLGLDHNFSGKGPPTLFETMIFNAAGDSVDCDRCATWAEAEDQHQHAVTETKLMAAGTTVKGKVDGIDR